MLESCIFFFFAIKTHLFRSRVTTGFFKYLIPRAMNYESRDGLTLLDEVPKGQDREIEWPKGALVLAKWRTSCRLSKIYGSYNALLSQQSNQARILIQIVIYRYIKLAVYCELIN